MTPKRLLIMLLGCAIIFGAVFGLRHFSSSAISSYLDNMPVPPATVQSTIAGKRVWQTQIEAPGSLVAELGADVSSEVGGIVTAIHAPSGSQVKKGELMIQLDENTDVAELKRLQAQAELTRLTFERRKKLFDLEAVSKADIEVAESEYAAAQAAVKAQKSKVANKRIRAPFDGDVGILKINLGSYLAPGEAAVSVRKLDPMLVDFELPERWVGKVQTGMKLEVTTEAQDGRSFEGVIDAIEPQIDTSSRNLKVRGKVPNTDRSLVPGQFARVTLSLPEQREYIIVPRTAIDYSAYGTSVYVLKEKTEGATDADQQPEKDAGGNAEPEATDDGPTHTAVRRFVELGPVRGDVIAVTKGLEAGERVATSGLVKLDNGMPVILDDSESLPAEEAPTPSRG